MVWCWMVCDGGGFPAAVLSGLILIASSMVSGLPCGGRERASTFPVMVAANGGVCGWLDPWTVSASGRS